MSSSGTAVIAMSEEIWIVNDVNLMYDKTVYVEESSECRGSLYTGGAKPFKLVFMVKQLKAGRQS